MAATPLAESVVSAPCSRRSWDLSGPSGWRRGRIRPRAESAPCGRRCPSGRRQLRRALPGFAAVAMAACGKATACPPPSWFVAADTSVTCVTASTEARGHGGDGAPRGGVASMPWRQRKPPCRIRRDAWPGRAGEPREKAPQGRRGPDGAAPVVEFLQGEPWQTGGTCHPARRIHRFLRQDYRKGPSTPRGSGSPRPR